MLPSQQLSWIIAERYVVVFVVVVVLLDIVVRFGFLKTLRKLKPSKIHMRAQICHWLIPFCLLQKILYPLLQIVNGMIWKFYVLALVGCGRLVKTKIREEIAYVSDMHAMSTTSWKQVSFQLIYNDLRVELNL